MLSPEQLQRLPKNLVQAMEDLEDDVLRDICRRLKLSGTVTETALQQIRVLQEQGFSMDYIDRRIQETLQKGQKEIDSMFDEAVERNEQFLKKALEKPDITRPQRDWREALYGEVEAIRRQTQKEFRNITRSLGFALQTGPKPQFYSVAQTYQRVLDMAALEVMTGAVDYNTAIRHGVSALAKSGLQFVDYASGHRDHADVAVRRAVMTGVTQCAGRMSETAMETLGTRYVETTAHSGARDTGEGYLNHKSWQGRWFYWSRRGERDPLGQYPDFLKETGYGEGGGLCGWNCRHSFYAVIPGVSRPAYTAEQLRNIDPPPFTWRGRQYTRYEATQEARRLERQMRAYKRGLIATGDGRDEDEYSVYKAKLRKKSKEYKEFCRAAGLRPQPERARIEGFGTREAGRARRMVSP